MLWLLILDLLVDYWKCGQICVRFFNLLFCFYTCQTEETDADGSRSVMMGGKTKGWLPDVVVIMWRRMLGALGDPNQVSSPQIHAAIFEYLVELGSVLVKIRQNQGVSADNSSTPPNPTFVPPLILLIPWCHQVRETLLNLLVVGIYESYL